MENALKLCITRMINMFFLLITNISRPLEYTSRFMLLIRFFCFENFSIQFDEMKLGCAIGYLETSRAIIIYKSQFISVFEDTIKAHAALLILMRCRF